METRERIEINQVWWSPRQIADSLNLTPQCVTAWCRSGALEAVRCGKVWRISDASLRHFLRRVHESAEAVRAGGEPGEFAEAVRHATNHAHDEEIERQFAE